METSKLSKNIIQDIPSKRIKVVLNYIDT